MLEIYIAPGPLGFYLVPLEANTPKNTHSNTGSKVKFPSSFPAVMENERSVKSSPSRSVTISVATTVPGGGERYMYVALVLWIIQSGRLVCHTTHCHQCPTVNTGTSRARPDRCTLTTLLLLTLSKGHPLHKRQLLAKDQSWPTFCGLFIQLYCQTVSVELWRIIVDVDHFHHQLSLHPGNTVTGMNTITAGVWS